MALDNKPMYLDAQAMHKFIEGWMGTASLHFTGYLVGFVLGVWWSTRESLTYIQQVVADAKWGFFLWSIISFCSLYFIDRSNIPETSQKVEVTAKLHRNVVHCMGVATIYCLICLDTFISVALNFMANQPFILSVQMLVPFHYLHVVGCYFVTRLLTEDEYILPFLVWRGIYTTKKE